MISQGIFTKYSLKTRTRRYFRPKQLETIYKAQIKYCTHIKDSVAIIGHTHSRPHLKRSHNCLLLQQPLILWTSYYILTVSHFSYSVLIILPDSSSSERRPPRIPSHKFLLKIFTYRCSRLIITYINFTNFIKSANVMSTVLPSLTNLLKILNSNLCDPNRL